MPISLKPPRSLPNILCVGEWRSLVAHLVWDQRVASSNLVSPTISSNFLKTINKFTAHVSVCVGYACTRRHEGGKGLLDGIKLVEKELGELR